MYKIAGNKLLPINSNALHFIMTVTLHRHHHIAKVCWAAYPSNLLLLLLLGLLLGLLLLLLQKEIRLLSRRLLQTDIIVRFYIFTAIMR